jgi:hypothetical protein
MRTTISLDDQFGLEIRQRAVAAGMSVSAFIARVLRDALSRAEGPQDIPPFQLITVGGDGPMEGVDLDRTGALLAAEDVALYGPRDD